MDKFHTNDGDHGFFSQFHDHPASVGETYWGHMAFAFGFGGKLILAGLCAVIHGLIPPFFTTTASDVIRQMHKKIVQRQG
ncbi:MAG: DUF6356 family protein [Pseudomonadota bacterium]